jgi:hypothetical protein
LAGTPEYTPPRIIVNKKAHRGGRIHTRATAPYGGLSQTLPAHSCDKPSSASVNPRVASRIGASQFAQGSKSKVPSAERRDQRQRRLPIVAGGFCPCRETHSLNPSLRESSI